MTKNIIIYGLGETATLAYEYFTHDSEYTVCAFTVDSDYKESDRFCDLPVVDFETVETSYAPNEYGLFVAAAGTQLNRIREKMYNKAKAKGYTCPSYVSSKAFVWHNVKIGENCFILEDNTLQPFTEIGNNVIMWSGNHLGHRSKIEDHSFITSHVVISGFCTIGHHAYIGVNASFADELKIAPDNFIGMGSVVTKSTEENSLYFGTPARKKNVDAKTFCKVQGE